MQSSYVVLGLLAKGGRHGYELKREHDLRFPQAKPLAYGQVYATLGRLLRDGLVEVEGAEAGDGPERTIYRLTGTGDTALRDWMSAVEPPAPYVANVLFAKVVVAMLTDESASSYLEAQRAAHLERMRELTRIKHDASSSISDVLAADFGLAHLDADLSWMDTTTQRLTMLAQEVRSL
jgi:DNA-binding PadR family transcriptional regulator